MRSYPLVLALAGAVLVSACGRSPSDVAFDNKVHDYLLRHPEMLREMAKALDDKEAAQASKQVAVALKEDRQAIEHDPRDFVAHPNAKITVVQFFDYNCAYCKIAGPQVVDLINRSPDVRFVFKELPVIGGPASERAARLALAVHNENGDYLSLYKDFISAKPLDDATADKILRAHGYDPLKLAEVASKTGVDQHIAESKALAQTIGIDGTPAFIVGDKMVSGADMQKVQAAIDKARAT